LFTERTTNQAERDNTYTFKVRFDANKLQIKEAIEVAFNVKVEEIRTINVHPKRKLDRYRGITGKTRRYKKAMVKVAKGDSIEFA